MIKKTKKVEVTESVTVNHVGEENAFESVKPKNIGKLDMVIADANPHPLGYTYDKCVVGNEIDWRVEAQKAANKKIKIDTVTITDARWYKELSAMTNGVSIPFHSGYKTANLVRATAWARGSMKSREKFDICMEDAALHDPEMHATFMSLKTERDKF